MKAKISKESKDYNILGTGKYANRPAHYNLGGTIADCQNLAKKTMNLDHPVYIRLERKVVLVFDAHGDRTWKEQFE